MVMIMEINEKKEIMESLKDLIKTKRLSIVGRRPAWHSMLHIITVGATEEGVCIDVELQDPSEITRLDKEAATGG